MKNPFIIFLLCLIALVGTVGIATVNSPMNNEIDTTNYRIMSEWVDKHPELLTKTSEYLKDDIINAFEYKKISKAKDDLIKEHYKSKLRIE